MSFWFAHRSVSLKIRFAGRWLCVTKYRVLSDARTPEVQRKLLRQVGQKLKDCERLANCEHSW